MKQRIWLAVAGLVLSACTAFNPLEADCQNDDDCGDNESCQFQVCVPEGTVSDAGIEPNGCVEGLMNPCGPCDQGEGNQTCQPDGTWGDCECPDEPKPTCVSADDCPAGQRCVGDECVACAFGAGMQEICGGGFDEDCDGDTDLNDSDCECLNGVEDPRPCGLNGGGIYLYICEDGRWSSGDRLCEDPDECVEDERRACGSSAGSCTPGTKTCRDGQWSECEGEVGPIDEICDNNLDDDCDGHNDDADDDCDQCNHAEWIANGGFPEGFDDSCDTGRQGVCAPGRRICLENNRLSDCIQEVQPSDEVCDGLDNDCDGNVDEGQPEVRTTCGVGACRSNGVRTCVGGQPEVDSCEPGPPGEEVANGADDDCDGQTDEGFACSPDDPPVEINCGRGACQRPGQVVCVAGAWEDQCVPGEPELLTDECNGIDDDCDGSIDEDAQPIREQCGLGQCTRIIDRRCINGAYEDTICEPFPPEEETCDERDNDCDGQTDEGFSVGEMCVSGLGACQLPGTTQCAALGGGTYCEPMGPPLHVPAESDLTCDGRDEDCDGNVDEDAPDQEAACGTGACQRRVMVSCLNGDYDEGLCEPGDPSPEICGDQVDNDCNGELDNGCDCAPGETQQCGEHNGGGACEFGEQRCIDGQWGPCEGAVNPLPEVCDGVDNDCDDVVDNVDGAGEQCEAGIGPCRAMGNIVCGEDGQLVCDAVALEGQPESCNMQDDDCDGQTDEDFQLGEPCTAGLGICQVNGVWICNVDETPICDQAPNPAEPSENCGEDGMGNGLDDDCDGDVDEGCGCDPGEDRPCGDFLEPEGACGPGQQICGENGEWGPCEGAVNPIDEICNDGIDDDCDGLEDEGVLNECGACGPVPEELCNELDDDCDGDFDEDFDLGGYCEPDPAACASGIPGFTECDPDDSSTTVCLGCAVNLRDAPLTESWNNGGELEFLYHFNGEGQWTCREFSGGNNLEVDSRNNNGQPLTADLRGAAGCGNGARSEQWRFFYDEEGRLSEIHRVRLPEELRRILTFEYNLDGTLWRQRWLDPARQFQRGYVYTSDDGGNAMFMVQTDDMDVPLPDGEVRHFDYSGAFPGFGGL